MTMDMTHEAILARTRSYYGREAALQESANTTREALHQALRQKWPSMGDRGPWVYIRDFGDDWVVVDYSVEGEEERHFQVPYSWSDGAVELGDPVEVVRREVWEKAHEQPQSFLTEVNGKAIVTGPVSALREVASDNPLFLHIDGRFVGAEKANRNGALWTTADLEIGRPTVRHGPLNWLHEERHVIGTLVRDEFVKPDRESASTLVEPYIGVESVVWKWLYPQEAATIEMAAAQQKAWYSMECISEKVHCTEPSCQKSYGYFEVIRAAEDICDHVKLKQVARRFENPTFLGGAIIVPPVRPGWADANIEVMREAAAFSESAWERAGAPASMTTDEWELLMAQIVRYAA